MKKVNDTEAFKGIEKSGLALKYSNVSISDFLKMHYRDMKEEIQEVKEQLKEVKEEDLFKNVFGDLKKVKAEIY